MSKERSIYTIIEEDRERLGLTDEEVKFIWAMGMAEWADFGKITVGNFKEYARALQRRKDMKMIKTGKKFIPFKKEINSTGDLGG